MSLLDHCMYGFQAINYFLKHSFNLNPAIMSAVELAMADHPIATTGDSNVPDETKTDTNASAEAEMAGETRTRADPDESSEVASGQRTPEVKGEGNDGANSVAWGFSSRARATGEERRATRVDFEAKSKMQSAGTGGIGGADRSCWWWNSEAKTESHRFPEVKLEETGRENGDVAPAWDQDPRVRAERTPSTQGHTGVAGDVGGTGCASTGDSGSSNRLPTYLQRNDVLPDGSLPGFIDTAGME